MNTAYQQQSNQLPFNTDRIINPPYQVNFNNLPINMQGLQTVPWLAPYTNVVTGLAMDSLMRTCQNGPLSTFLYNMMSTQNWNNQQFLNLVQDLSDYIFIENQNWTPAPHQIEGVIQTGVANFMPMRTLACLIEFPQLWYYIQEPDKPAINVKLGEYQNTMARIMRMRQDTAMNPSMGQPVGYYPQQQMQQPMQGGYYPQQPVRPQGHVPFTAAGQSAYQNSQPGVVTMGAGPGYGPQVRTASGGRDFGGAAPAHQQMQQPMQQQTMQHHAQPASTLVPPIQPNQQSQPQQPTHAQGKETVMNTTGTAIPMDPSLRTPDEVTWRASPNHPALCYPPAFNPVTHHLYLSVQPDGSTTPVMQESGINMIDYDRHAVASLFGKPIPGSYVAKDNKQVMAKIDVGVTSIKNEMDEATEDNPTVLTKPKLLHEVSLDNAISTLQAENMLLQLTKKPTVFRGFVRVVTPIIGWEDETEQVAAFARCSSYIALREEIKAAAENSSPELVTTVNLRVTAHVNHILQNRLSIAKDTLMVEDFVADLDGLLSFLSENFGEHIQKAFLKNQRQEIAQLFQTLTRGDGYESVYQALVSNLLADTFEGAAKTPEVTFVGTTYSITFIDAISHDLQVAGVEGVGNVLLKDFQPSLSALAKNIIQSSDHLNWEASRHLVRTKDGRMFEISKGNINEDFVLISLVN